MENGGRTLFTIHSQAPLVFGIGEGWVSRYPGELVSGGEQTTVGLSA